MKTKVIDVAVFLNDSVESKGKDKVGCGRHLSALVWLGLADGWEGRDPDSVRTWRRKVTLQVMVGKLIVNGFCRKGDLGFEISFCIAKKSELLSLAGLPAGRKYDQWTREVTGVQTVSVIAGSSVGGIANLDSVHPVLRGDYAQGAVLQKQFAVVGGGELEALVVK